MKWDITNRATGHFDVADVSIEGVRCGGATAHPSANLLVKERFKDDNLVPGFNEAHKSTQHPFSCDKCQPGMLR